MSKEAAEQHKANGKLNLYMCVKYWHYFSLKGNKLFAEKQFEEAIKEYTNAIVK